MSDGSLGFYVLKSIYQLEFTFFGKLAHLGRRQNLWGTQGGTLGQSYAGIGQLELIGVAREREDQLLLGDTQT